MASQIAYDADPERTGTAKSPKPMIPVEKITLATYPELGRYGLKVLGFCGICGCCDICYAVTM